MHSAALCRADCRLFCYAYSTYVLLCRRLVCAFTSRCTHKTQIQKQKNAKKSKSGEGGTEFRDGSGKSYLASPLAMLRAESSVRGQRFAEGVQVYRGTNVQLQMYTRRPGDVVRAEGRWVVGC